MILVYLWKTINVRKFIFCRPKKIIINECYYNILLIKLLLLLSL